MSDTSKPGQGSTTPSKPPVPPKPATITLKTVRVTDSVDPSKVRATLSEDKTD